MSARKPARYRIRKSIAMGWWDRQPRWQIIDTHATEWCDYVCAKFPTGAEAIAAFARGAQ